MRFIDIDRAFSKEELVYVYRKVKRDLYFEKDNIRLDKIVEFEDNLENNINFLYNLLLDEDVEKIISQIEVGSITFLYKNISFDEVNAPKLIAPRTVENFKKKIFKIKEVECRFMGDISLLFQIIGGLWINRLGYQIDEMLSDNVYGCRLEKLNKKSKLKYFEQNNTLFKPYFTDFKNWQNNLFEKIEHSNKDIIVITSDLTKYYHTIDINLLEKKINEVLNDEEFNTGNFDIFLNRILFSLLRKFNRLNNTFYYTFYSEYKEEDIQNKGLPLTLNVSKVLANFYLKEFDKDVEKNVKPLYYGRYVDDFIIAVENNSKQNINLKTILQGLKNHSITTENRILQKKSSQNNNENLLGVFNTEKEKVFLFNYEKDKTEINHLKKAINKNSSEWKLIPDTSEYEEIETSDFFHETNKDCEDVDSLRKSTGLTIKRNQFVREIIGFENNINFLQKEYWGNRLDKFLNLILDYVFDLKNFVDLSKYIPRLFGLIIHSSSKDLQSTYFDRLFEVFDILVQHMEENYAEFANEFLKQKIFETIVGSLPLDLNESKHYSAIILEKYLYNYYIRYKLELKYKIITYFNTDLHRIPYKDCYFKYDEYVRYLNGNLCKWKEELIKFKFFTWKEIEFVANNLHSNQCGCDDKNCEIECKAITESSGFYFYTRKISLLELTVAFKNKIITDYENFSQLAESYYYKLDIHSHKMVQEKDYYFVDFDKKNHDIQSLNNPIIATTHFLTNYSSYDANVRHILDTDLNRADRLIKIVNNVIRSKEKINYLVFHEVALPRDLYVQLATKLSFVGINLVAGLDYKIDRDRSEVDNQLVYILLNENDNQSIALYQSKLIGAIHENQDIMEKANLRIVPRFKEKLIIRHSGFVFSGLICNDLLYIDNRASLVGKIDNLFVLAWNQDIETYDNLVKSSCLDIHCFITLCNNREYGDTRIRAPYKESWKRDIMKIHGGTLDNFVLAELDIESLRNFQTNEIPPKIPFKPFPIGFKISEERRLI